jgi:hypothetical protein
MTTAAAARRALPALWHNTSTSTDTGTGSTGLVWQFRHRGLNFTTYRPVGFDGTATPVTYGWSVFWNTTPQGREEITGGWATRAAAVRAALAAVDRRAEANAQHAQSQAAVLALPQHDRCCAHLDARHVPGRYGPTRCTAKRCGCAMYQRGPLTAIRPQDIPDGAVLIVHTRPHGAFEFPVAGPVHAPRPEAADGPGTDTVAVMSATGEAAEFAAGSVAYALAHTVPDSVPRVE